MTQIVLDDKQAAALVASQGKARLCDAKGKTLAIAEPVFSEEEIGEVRRRTAASDVWYTTDQVLAHLESLDAK
jgi:hypothetical protein